MKNIFSWLLASGGLSKSNRPEFNEERSWDWSRYGCPDCGGKEIFLGPSGGMCTNICCTNPLCRSAFNDMGIMQMLHRIPNSSFRTAFPECSEESEAYLSITRS